MSEDNKTKFDWAMLFTAVWVIFFVALLIRGFNAEEGFGGLGAFLSGIFAPLALVWFYRSYQLQREELGLQRKELRLQREALEKQVEELLLTRKEITLQRQALQHQVTAQQGSEKALNAQSIALQEQLEITQEQFEIFLQNENLKRPSFELISIDKFNVEFVEAKFADNDRKKAKKLDILSLRITKLPKTNNYILKSVSIEFSIKNYGIQGDLLSVRGYLNSNIICTNLDLI